MNVTAYRGIAYEDNWAKSAQVDRSKTYCWKRGDNVSGVVAEFFHISRVPMKVICENIK